MKGKTCLVTGGSDGIGLATALALAGMGAKTVIVGRNPAKTEAAAQRIVRETGNEETRYLLADLSSQQEVRRLAEQVRALLGREGPRLDVLVNNAGAIFLSNRQSVDGIEMTFALNHLGYFLLTTLLLDLVVGDRLAGRASASASGSAPGSAWGAGRIVNVSSSSHYGVEELDLEDLARPKVGGYRAYGRSKLCNVLFTYELARRLAGAAELPPGLPPELSAEQTPGLPPEQTPEQTPEQRQQQQPGQGGGGVTVNAVHPGLVRTGIARNNGVLGRVANLFIGVRGVSVERGADTPVYLASSPEVEGVTGRFFVDRRDVPSSSLSYDAALAAELWELSEGLTGGAGGL